VIVCAVATGATTLAMARPFAGGPATLQPAPGSGQFRFAGTGTSGSAIEGTATTKVVPATIKPGEAATFTVGLTWTETDQKATCSFGSASGSTPGQTFKGETFPLQPIRPGHGEDLLVAARVTNAPADYTGNNNASTWTCGPPNRLTRTEGYVARVSGADTAKYAAGCYAASPSAGYPAYAYLGAGATYEGTFATLSVGGVDCTGGAAPAATAFTDTFSAAGQAKPHAVTVPATRTKAEVTLRWAKPGDRFTIASVVLVPKRKTASVGQAEKLKITFFSVTPTSVGVRITNLAPGKLTFRVVSKKQNGTTSVRTRVILKA
jgi:hypothetical protein